MRFATLLFLGSLVSGLIGQDVIDNFRVNRNLNPYIGSDGLVVRSIEDNVLVEQWPEAKRSAYSQYPLASEMSEVSIPKTAAEAYALLKAQNKPIAIGHRWVKSLSDPNGPPLPRRLVFWLEPRPKYLNDDELKKAAEGGEFDSLFPTFPIGKFALVEGRRPSSRYVPFPIPAVATSMSLNGVPPDGPKGEVRPITVSIDLYSAWSFPSEELIAQEIDQEMEILGSGRILPKKRNKGHPLID